MNIQVCLEYLQLHWPQQFSFLIAEDLFASESAGWELFGKLFDMFAGNSSTQKQNTDKGIQHNPAKEQRSSNHPTKGGKGRATSPVELNGKPVPTAPLKKKHVQFCADDGDIGRVRLGGGKGSNRHLQIHSDKILPERMEPTADDRGPYESIRALDIRRAEMRKERLAVRRRRLTALESAEEGSTQKSILKLHDNPWDDRMTIVRPKPSRSASPNRKPLDLNEKANDAARNLNTRRNDATINDWFPPQASKIDFETAQQELHTLPPITSAQQVTVREWLEQLGLTLVDGEGGFFHHNPTASSASPLPAVPLPIHAGKRYFLHCCEKMLCTVRHLNRSSPKR